EPGDREHRPLGRARLDEGDTALRGGERARQSRLEPIVFVAEVPRAHDAALIVLDLEHRQTGEVHRSARVVEQVGAVAPLQHRRSESVVRGDGIGQGVEPARDRGAVPGQVGPDHRRQPCDAALVLGGEAAWHLGAHAHAEQRERYQHDHAEPGEDAGPEGHRGEMRGVPSQSTCRGGRPRRTRAWGRTSSNGSTVPVQLQGGSSSAARQTSNTRRRSGSTYAASPPARSAAANTACASPAAAARLPIVPTSTSPGRVAAYSSTAGSPVITRSEPSSTASRVRPAGTVATRRTGRAPRRTGTADRTPAASVSLTQWLPVPIGQSPPGARFVTA